MDLARATLLSLGFAVAAPLAAPLGAQHLVPLGDEVRLTPEETCRHLDPDVAWTSTGGRVVAWRNGAVGIVARTAPAPGLEYGPEVALVEGGAISPAVAPAADGGFWLAWEQGTVSGEEVALQRFTGEGDPWGRPIVTGFRAFGFAPALAPLPGGGVAVAWNAFDGDTVRLALRRYAADGSPLEGEVTVASEPQHDPDLVEVVYLDLELASQPGGGLLVAWSRSRTSRGEGRQVMVRAFDGGAALGEALALTPLTPRLGGPSAVAAPDGYLIGWGAPEGAGVAVFLERLDLSGRPAGETSRLVEAGAGDFIGGPWLAADGARVTAAWTEFTPGVDGDAFLRPLDTAGRPVGPKVRLNHPLGETLGPDHSVVNVDLAARGGRLAAVWQILRNTPVLPSDCEIGDAVFARDFRAGGRRPPGPGWRPRSPSWPSGGRGLSP